MSHTQEGPHSDRLDARIAEAHQTAGPHGDDAVEATDDRRRRWYHLRPEPRRRTDVMGWNSTWWMALVWLLVILVAVYPLPWVVVR
jgi:hypothetical protein